MTYMSVELSVDDDSNSLSLKIKSKMADKIQKFKQSLPTASNNNVAFSTGDRYMAKGISVPIKTKREPENIKNTPTSLVDPRLSRYNTNTSNTAIGSDNSLEPSYCKNSSKYMTECISVPTETKREPKNLKNTPTSLVDPRLSRYNTNTSNTAIGSENLLDPSYCRLSSRYRAEGISVPNETKKEPENLKDRSAGLVDPMISRYNTSTSNTALGSDDLLDPSYCGLSSRCIAESISVPTETKREPENIKDTPTSLVDPRLSRYSTNTSNTAIGYDNSLEPSYCKNSSKFMTECISAPTETKREPENIKDKPTSLVNPSLYTTSTNNLTIGSGNPLDQCYYELSSYEYRPSKTGVGNKSEQKETKKTKPLKRRSTGFGVHINDASLIMKMLEELNMREIKQALLRKIRCRERKKGAKRLAKLSSGVTVQSRDNSNRADDDVGNDNNVSNEEGNIETREKLNDGKNGELEMTDVRELLDRKIRRRERKEVKRLAKLSCGVTVQSSDNANYGNVHASSNDISLHGEKNDGKSKRSEMTDVEQEVIKQSLPTVPDGGNELSSVTDTSISKNVCDLTWDHPRYGPTYFARPVGDSHCGITTNLKEKIRRNREQRKRKQREEEKEKRRAMTKLYIKY